MTNNNHPVTPPPELVQQWECEYHHMTWGPDMSMFLTEKAARWGADQQLQLDAEQINQAWQKGADQELEACCELLKQKGVPAWSLLRLHRRPKPPSLKEQALADLEGIPIWGSVSDPENRTLLSALDNIRRALESLPE